MNEKKSIREKILSLRESLSQDEAKSKSRMIFQNLVKFEPFVRAKTVHIYVSSKKNEVDTKEIIKFLLESGKKVVVPVVNKKTKTLIHSELNSLDELTLGTFGILEPRIVREVDVKEIDIVIVPAVAVDRKGNRVGFGGGYYDRFLSQTDAVKIALVYDFQIVDEIPADEKDVAVDFVITESEIINCR